MIYYVPPKVFQNKLIGYEMITPMILLPVKHDFPNDVPSLETLIEAERGLKEKDWDRY